MNASPGLMTVSANVNLGSGAGSLPSLSYLVSGWGAVALALLILIILFAVYYETVGYYIQLGWDKMEWSKRRGEKVEISVPGGPAVQLTPLDHGSSAHGSSAPGLMNRLESDVAVALGEVGSGKQVFNVNRNLYTFSEAEPLCRAFGAELASYDQVKHAYKNGADWCNYGWVKGQLAVYPTQKATYDKLQSGPEEDRMSCGLPGVNGGYFPNEDQRFGVNCYGERPAESALDKRMQQAEHSDIAFDRQVNHYKSELDSIAVNPWSGKQWSA